MKNEQKKSHILMVESIGFSIIIALSWLTEAVGFPHLVYDEPFTPNWNRALLRSIVVLIIWFFVHIETKRLLRRLHHLEEYLLVCSWCRKIGDKDTWLSMEQYFGTNFATRTTHGMCPECSKKMLERALAGKKLE